MASPSKKVKGDASSKKEFQNEPHIEKQTESEFPKQTRKRRSPRLDIQDNKMSKDTNKSSRKGK